MKKITFLISLISLILVGCTPATQYLTNASDTVQEKVDMEKQKTENKTQALIKCQELCQETLSTDGQDFNIGPCLSNEIMPGWVCDVAHSPRQEVDNDPANQCSAFRAGKADHFIEVDGNCNVIQSK